MTRSDFVNRWWGKIGITTRHYVENNRGYQQLAWNGVQLQMPRGQIPELEDHLVNHFLLSEIVKYGKEAVAGRVWYNKTKDCFALWTGKRIEVMEGV